jgi:hypothetical protein
LGCGEVFDTARDCSDHTTAYHDGLFDLNRNDVIARFASLIFVFLKDLARAVGLPTDNVKRLGLAFLTKGAQAICNLGTLGPHRLPRHSVAYGLDSNLANLGRKSLHHNKDSVFSLPRHESTAIRLAWALNEVHLSETNDYLGPRGCVSFVEARSIVYLLAGIRNKEGLRVMQAWQRRPQWYQIQVVSAPIVNSNSKQFILDHILNYKHYGRVKFGSWERNT